MVLLKSNYTVTRCLWNPPFEKKHIGYITRLGCSEWLVARTPESKVLLFRWHFNRAFYQSPNKSYTWKPTNSLLQYRIDGRVKGERLINSLIAAQCTLHCQRRLSIILWAYFSSSDSFYVEMNLLSGYMMGWECDIWKFDTPTWSFVLILLQFKGLKEARWSLKHDSWGLK